MANAINPNSVRSTVNSANINDSNAYPLFFNSIRFEEFRHLKNLHIDFKNPITVISGVNKSGKTTILLSIACSHYNFKRRNLSTGILERFKWGDIMKFTKFDIQKRDWTYYVSHREGIKYYNDRRGQRKHQTNKWNGVAKKESQIGTPTSHKPDGGRNVVMVDLERILPARGLSSSHYAKIRNRRLSSSMNNTKQEYLSYVLELDYKVNLILKTADKEIIEFKSGKQNYSTYNSASGEDVLFRIISDIVDAEKNSLILIEEIEIGLHPKIQRRLMDVLYKESSVNKKQFIITTHSSTILSSVDVTSRIFIDKFINDFKVIKNISVSAALSKMDSHSYPLINLFVEDEVSQKIVKKAIAEVSKEKKRPGFKDLVNVIVSGAANDAYDNFKCHKRTHLNKKHEPGYACILDGDMRTNFNTEDGLFFLYSSSAPELFLVDEYLKKHSHPTMTYHLTSDPHCLFQKMVENHLSNDVDEAFEICWKVFARTGHGKVFLKELSNFIVDECKRFSPVL